jgi:heptosyltransferase-1
MKLLVVKTSSMGDVVHTMPALTEALASRPDLRVDWMVERPFAPVVALHPGVERIHLVETRRWRRRPLTAETWKEIGGLRRDLRAARYDLVLDAQGLMKSAVLARLAGAPVHGLDAGSAREGIAARLYAHGHAVPRAMHAIDRTRALFGQVLGYEPAGTGCVFGLSAPVPAKDYSDAAFLLHGTSWDSKKWPVGHWIALARQLAAEGLRPVATWGNEVERASAEAIAEGVPALEIVPRSGLDAIAAILGQVRLVVGVDTGLTHLAAALDRPTVAIFVASRSGLTGPRGRRVAILDGGTADDLSPVSRSDGPAGAAIVPQDVLKAALDLLA